ncbi:uncharacterized protein [Diadema antillarum]|uniref:uncharacterized protein n=1 Tax=Diadema antillarum TaxID=105358 RepID=UPI003A8A29AD
MPVATNDFQGGCHQGSLLYIDFPRLRMQSKDLVPFESAKGQNLLNDTAIRQTLLVRIFSKQRAMGYCGVQTAGLLMSARCFGKKYPEQREQTLCDVSNVPYRDTNLFSFPHTTAVIDEDRLLRFGITLKQLQELLQSFGLPAKRIYADDTNVDEFRSLATAALSHADSSQGVVVNYEYHWVKDGKTMVDGHFCALAAYHERSDRFLMMDSCLDGQVVWAPTVDIFRQMSTTDSDSGLGRGFLIMGL